MDTLIKLYKSFETDRLIIRPTGMQDAPFIFQLMNTPKWLEFIGDRQIVSVDAAGSYIRTKMLPQLERLGFSNYTVIRKSDNVKLGSCGLYDREGLNGIDIGFAFLPEFGRQGYAFEAAARLMQAAKEDFGLTRICGITDENNLASQRLLEKLGLNRNGSIQLTNEASPVWLYVWDAEKN